MTPPSSPRRVYAAPAGDDDPLDPIEEALVRALVDILLPKLRAELAAKAITPSAPKLETPR